jgi:surface protein
MQIGINIAVKGVGATGPPPPPSAPVNSVSPFIYGNSDLGSLLTTTDGTWSGNPSPTFAYQWKRGATNIGTNTNTYTLVAADSASAITCVVTATNALGSANATSNVITAQTYLAPVNTVAPVISGTTTLGSVLTSTTGTFTGNPSPTFAYQWKRGATNIGTNSSTYTLVIGDSTASITCVVTATNALGSANATSNAIIASNYIPVNSVLPVISGTTTLGSLLTTTDGTWSNSPTFTYQWQRNASNITSATASTYTLVLADSLANITCIVTATNAVGSTPATSNTITADNYAAVPVVISSPVISGTTTLGSLLTSTDGTWSNSPSSFAYQWNRNGLPIASATASSYTLVTADSASAITCVVIATNGAGSSAPSTSNTITAGAFGSAFTSTWLVSAGQTITLPYEATGNYSGTIDWGDSNTSPNIYANISHTYTTAGTYTISITGTIIGFRFNFTGSRNVIRTITNWGTLRLGNNGNYFQGCQQLTLNTVAGTLDLTGTTNFANIFDSCTALTTVNGINSWSTGAITAFSNMFGSCVNFNQALSFPVSTSTSVTMTSMFNGCANFNSALTFNISSVNSTNFMFYGATAFNQNIGTWNTGAVTNMSSMFNGATAFQQNIGSWNVANVTNFTNFMASKTNLTFSTANLDAIYNGWVTVQSSRTISFGTAKYSAAGVAGRAYLTGTQLWTITDGGL